MESPKNSQTKSSLISTTHEIEDGDDDGGDTSNQDFSEIDNQQFEKLLNTKNHGNKNVYYHPSKSSILLTKFFLFCFALIPRRACNFHLCKSENVKRGFTLLCVITALTSEKNICVNSFMYLVILKYL